MEQQELLIKMIIQAWAGVVGRTTKLISHLTDEELNHQVAPDRSTGIFILSHITKGSDKMRDILFLGDRIFPDLDEKTVMSPAEWRDAWSKVNDTLLEQLQAVPVADWFKRHASMTDEDLVADPGRNRLSVLLTRMNHLSYHLGQLVLINPASTK